MREIQGKHKTWILPLKSSGPRWGEWTRTQETIGGLGQEARSDGTEHDTGDEDKLPAKGKKKREDWVGWSFTTRRVEEALQAG